LKVTFDAQTQVNDDIISLVYFYKQSGTRFGSRPSFTVFWKTAKIIEFFLTYFTSEIL